MRFVTALPAVLLRIMFKLCGARSLFPRFGICERAIGVHGARLDV